MKIAVLLFICGFLGGCNYSLSKSPLNFQSGTTGIEATSPGQIVTYAVIHSAIMQPKCIECHSSAGGDAGGINLETYENVAANLGIIRSEVATDSMPKNRTKLTAGQKSMLLTWIDAGAPLNGSTPVITKPTEPPAPPLPPTDPTPPQVEFITYEMVNAKVIQPRCLGCHSEAGGNRGDVNLETYENVAALVSTIEAEIKSGSMPRPKNKPLTAEQKDLILKWIASGAPKS